MVKLKDKTILSLVKQGTVRNYNSGQLILYEGDVSSNVFYIYKGAVKIYSIDASGNENILTIAGVGDMFPALPVGMQQNEVEYFHGAISDISLVAIPKDIFMDELHQNINLALYCLKWFSRKHLMLTERVKSLERTDTKNKLYAALLFLKQDHCKKRLNGWHRVNFQVSQQLLADLTGVSRESINIAIQEAIREKIIRNPRSKVLEIHSNNLIKAFS